MRGQLKPSDRSDSIRTVVAVEVVGAEVVGGDEDVAVEGGDEITKNSAVRTSYFFIKF